MEDMKSYYQQQKGGFTLPECVYAKTVKEIRCYNYFATLIERIAAKSEINITEKDIENSVIAKRYVKAVDAALEHYVSDEYRDAVFEHIILGIEYDVLEELYYFDASTLKRWVQKFIYGVAVELGEDFK